MTNHINTPLHVAFAAPDRATVEAFHAEALAAGGRDNGPPGLRAHYHPSYFGGFVLDPDGNNVEAVTHRPERRGASRRP
jgi:catechol 2,3-dioxygenase-like lactoylglutathione lyase family enzyme